MIRKVKDGHSCCENIRRAFLSLGLLVTTGCAADLPVPGGAREDDQPTDLAQLNGCRSGQPEVAVCDMSKLETGKTWVTIGDQSQQVSYKLVGTGNRKMVMQSDIVIGYERDFQPSRGGSQAAVGLTGFGSTWPNGRIPYVYDDSMRVRDRVEAAMRVWESKTPIKFVPKTAGDTAYVKIFSSSGYSSRVGRVGKEQFLDIKLDPDVGSIIHELGHTIGLFHEQSRSDRDRYVRVDIENVWEEKREDFVKLAGIIGVSDYGPYDFTSIMHYPWNAFAKDPALPTIEILPGAPVPADLNYQTMGQRDEPSAGDFDAVNKMYAK